MLPLKLVLKGLYSYQKEQTIDFTRLTEGKLFGIFGAVGSGKSSILEAISFALYGETERLNLRDNRGYNMMNLKCGELFIDFTFLAGSAQREYRSIVSCKRHKTIFEKVPSIERKAYIKSEEEWLPVEVSEIPRAIGLTYDNFRRTIIIPQGKFSEFLQLGDKDRTEMLKEIFHLERFEYSAQVGSLDKKNNEKINIVEGKLEQVGEVSQEQIEEQKGVLKELNDAVSQLTVVLEEKVKEEKRLSELKQLFTKLASIKKDRMLLAEKKDYFKKLKDDLEDYEFALLHLKPLIDTKNENERKVLSLQNEINHAESVLKANTTRLEKEEQELIEVEKAFAKKDQLKEEIEELKKIINIQKLLKEVAVIEERVSNGKRLLSSVENLLGELEEQREESKRSLAAKKDQLPDILIISEISNWFIIEKGLNESIAKSESEINELTKKRDQFNSFDFKEILNGLGVDKANNPDQLEILKLLKLKKEEIIKEQDLLSQKIEHLSVESRLEDLVTNLSPGNPCPLCGSIHHPAVFNAESVSESLKSLKNKKLDLTTVLKEIENKIVNQQEKIFQLNALQLQIDRAKKELEASEEKLNLHKSSFSWKDYENKTYQDIENLTKEAKKAQIEIKGAEALLDSLEKKIQQESEKREKYNKGLQQLSLELAAKTTEQSTFKNQLLKLRYSDYQQKVENDIIEEISKLDRAYSMVLEQYEKLSASVVRLKEEIAKTDGQLREKKKGLEDLMQSLKNNSQRISEALSNSKFDSLIDVESILSRRIDLDFERQRLREYEDRVILTDQTLRELEVETKDQSYEPEKHNQLLSLIEEQKDLITKSNKETGRIAELVSRLVQNLKDKEALSVELKKLQNRKEEINVLKQLFKGSGFVNYVSSIFLRNLCNSANERFYKLTRQKLRLELTENNNFQVRDFLNNGQVRSVKTLSGGQTFQASLSLALALAESIQQQNKAKQNFFFLDEGFGSLDKDSLNLVFDTLKSLRKEDRIVGIISHVNELQQEIDVYLNVINDEERGSLVKGSWQ